MEKNYTKIYKDDILNLAASIAIKSDTTAEMINNGLLVKYGPTVINRHDRSSWKYYMNISGDYHPTDTKMYVTSMDTLETIEFSKTSLLIHTATAKGYSYGTLPYKELVSKFPDQETLIRGILYPCDINKAITCRDGTILAYPKNLVEEYEYSLISNLQTWIYGFFQRWNNAAFNISDELYHPSMLAVLYSCMVGAIYCIRKEACKTNEVHSYHLRNYLSSNSNLAEYLPYLNRHQALWLYRNIKTIQHNAGHRDTFEWLVENLFTARKLPLSAFEMSHDLANCASNMGPLVVFRRRELNEIGSASDRHIFSTSEIYDKQNNLARDNRIYRDEYDAVVPVRMENSLSNKLNTKLLESSMVNPEGSEKYTLEDIRLNHWLYLGYLNKYRAVIPFTSPQTGEVVYMTALNAFALYLYLHAKSNNITIIDMPAVIAKRVMSIPKTPIQTIRNIITSDVSQIFISQAHSLMPDAMDIYSIDSFYEYTKKLWRAANDQWRMVCVDSDLNTRAMKHAAITRMWRNEHIQLGIAGETYSDFFARNSLSIESYTANEIIIAKDNLLQASLGLARSDELSVVGIQRAMAEILSKLSSYSIHISRDINETPIRDAGQTAIRTGNITTIGTGISGLHSGTDVLDVTSTSKATIAYDMGGIGSGVIAKGRSTHDADISIGVTLKVISNKPNEVINISPGVSFTAILDPLPAEYADLVNCSGLSNFLQLPEHDKRKIPFFI